MRGAWNRSLFKRSVSIAVGLFSLSRRERRTKRRLAAGKLGSSFPFSDPSPFVACSRNRRESASTY